MKSFVLLFCFILLFSCNKSEVQTNLVPDADIGVIDTSFFKSFVVNLHDGTVPKVSIDNNRKLVLIDYDINSANSIVDVDYVLSDSTLITPDPKDIFQDKPLKIINKFILRAQSGKSYPYKVIFNGTEITTDVTINVDEKKQKILFIGGDMERSQSFMQKAKDPLLVAKWCFSDIPFEVCRVSYDKKQELIEGTNNFNFYTDAIKSMQMIKEVNPDIEFWATMKSDYNGYNDENNLPDWITDYGKYSFFKTEKYAVFLADYLQLMEENGVPVSYLSTAKEWIQAVTADRAIDIIESLKAECQNRNIKEPKFVDPASWGITQGVNFVNAIKQKNKESLYYGFSTHNLNGNEHDKFLYKNFVDAVEPTAKYVFADETGYGNGGKLNGAEPVDLTDVIEKYIEKTKFYNAGIQGELFFEVFSRGVATENRSVYFQSGTQPKRMRSYYIMKEFAKGLAGKDKSYVDIKEGFESIDGIHTMNFSNDNECFSVFINDNDEAKVLNVEVASDDIIVEDVDKSYFDISIPIEGKKEESEYVFTDNKYILELTPKSIVFLKFNYEKEND